MRHLIHLLPGFWLAMAAAATSASDIAMASEPIDESSDAGAIAERLGEYFDALTAIDQFNGVVLWAEGDNALLKKDYELTGAPETAGVTTDSSFHIASIRKLFSEWLLHDAASRGLLDFDDTIDRFFGDFPRGDEITIRHLLDHQSGLPRGERYQFEDRYYPIEDYLPLIAAQELEFEPGSETRYSNFGYMMIDLILQEATGLHPSKLLKNRLFEPMGMTQSGEYHQGDRELTLATGIAEADDGQLHAVSELDMAQFETGNVFSSAADLLAFVRHPSSESRLAEGGRIAHAGGKKGFRSWLNHDAGSDRTLLVLSNLSTTPIQRVIDDTDAILAGQRVALPARIQRERVEIAREKLSRYVGRYRVVANGQVLDIRLEADGLVIYEVTDDGLEDPQPIHPESERTFFIEADSSDTIRFDPAGDGESWAMHLTIMGGFELETERLP
jgi:CubicO group peptidase (beta-lactamase class C family)